MGGREHDLALGGEVVKPDDTHIREVLTERIMLFPALVSETGPFAGAQADWSGAEPVPGSGQRSAAVGFYLALVTARCLDLIGHQGAVVVEGPFARNRPYLWMLGEASASPVIAMNSTTGTSQGAALLAAKDGPRNPKGSPVSVPGEQTRDLLATYAREWKTSCNRRSGSQR